MDDVDDEEEEELVGEEDEEDAEGSVIAGNVQEELGEEEEESEESVVVVDVEEEVGAVERSGRAEIDAFYDLSNTLVTYFTCPCCRTPTVTSFHVCV